MNLFRRERRQAERTDERMLEKRRRDDEAEPREEDEERESAQAFETWRQTQHNYDRLRALEVEVDVLGRAV